MGVDPWRVSTAFSNFLTFGGVPSRSVFENSWERLGLSFDLSSFKSFSIFLDSQIIRTEEQKENLNKGGRAGVKTFPRFQEFDFDGSLEKETKRNSKLINEHSTKFLCARWITFNVLCKNFSFLGIPEFEQQPLKKYSDSPVAFNESVVSIPFSPFSQHTSSYPHTDEAFLPLQKQSSQVLPEISDKNSFSSQET